MVAAAVSWVLCACAGRGSRPATANAQGRGDSGILMLAKELPGSGNLLDAMRSRVPTMNVTNVVGNCPRIMFRGQRSGRSQENPVIYVDGTRVGDTCALSQVTVSDVDSVVIYPGGRAPRSDVQGSPFGLILVYRKY
jgi:hypothetical protein